MGAGASPATTTLLALFCHDGDLWAIPDINPANPSASYKLHRLDLAMQEWQVVAVLGQPPLARAEACAVCMDGHLLVGFG